MAANLQTAPETNSVPGLLTGIVHDIQELLKQQLNLFKAEFRDTMRKSREGSVCLAIGAGFLLLGSVMACLTLVYLLNWLFPAALPLWACYLIVAGALSVPGAVMIYLGWERFHSVTMLDQTTEALEENLEWTTKPK
jgi:hypothetical protein